MHTSGTASCQVLFDNVDENKASLKRESVGCWIVTCEESRPSGMIEKILARFLGIFHRFFLFLFLFSTSTMQIFVLKIN